MTKMNKEMYKDFLPIETDFKVGGIKYEVRFMLSQEVSVMGSNCKMVVDPMCSHKFWWIQQVKYGTNDYTFTEDDRQFSSTINEDTGIKIKFTMSVSKKETKKEIEEKVYRLARYYSIKALNNIYSILE